MTNETKKLLKGCGREWFDSESGGLYENCGEDGEYCDKCKARISEHLTVKKQWLKQVEEVLGFLESSDIQTNFHLYNCDAPPCVSYREGLEKQKTLAEQLKKEIQELEEDLK